MADFDTAFELTMAAEGGYVHDPDDPGGETYKGVARARNPKWPGWKEIDWLKKSDDFPDNLDAHPALQSQIKNLYKANYWDKIRGDDITEQDIAASIFDFAVNAGPKTSAKLAQITVGAKADGIVGPKTLKKINADDKRAFLAVFALAKIGRYVDICEKRKASRKYFFGWVRRTLEGI
ncbi:glycoside hydrolase family 108 protein [Thalassomonas actiniarum]|uniref:N-acetylmuramidase n=1 Tax=Thalassomonas actiniarum TaxID=485447 RepID=A0AAE9YT93_9GAMM|nr:glycosyl hydrolase 108 family protein [Thalassomonas actiniarum]WDE00776.1 N-acetylmuramidase [Thalassomonas actiniarum]